MKTLRDIPVLSGAKWDGHASEFRSSRGELLLRAMREHADICAIRMFNLSVILPFSPALVHETMVEKARSTEKSLGVRMMFYPFAGHGLFTSEGDAWRRQRKLMAPLFQPAAVRSYAPQINDVIGRELDGWKEGDVIDVGREMTRITMNVVGKVLFDADRLDEVDEISNAVTLMFEYLGEQSASLSILVRATLVGGLTALGKLPTAMDRVRADAIEWLSNPVPLPTAGRRRLREGIATLDATIQRMIEERRRKGERRDDLLTRLLAARDEDDGSFMTDKQLRDEAVTLFVAGHETTATGMTWSLYFLSRTPEAYRRWKEEIAALGGRMPTAEDAARLVYSRGIFKEALRLYPPAFAWDRFLLEDAQIGGYHVPKGTGIILSPYAMHRRADLWPDPERFDPARFSPEAEAARPRGTWFPFGLGPRVCIGASFAQLEAELLLAQIAQRFELEAVEQEPIGASFTGALRPERPVRLRVRARREAQVQPEMTA